MLPMDRRPTLRMVARLALVPHGPSSSSGSAAIAQSALGPPRTNAANAAFLTDTYPASEVTSFPNSGNICERMHNHLRLKLPEAVTILLNLMYPLHKRVATKTSRLRMPTHPSQIFKN